MSEPTRVYENSSIRVEWRPELCIKCQLCHTGLPQVFDPEKRPWVNIEGAEPEAIAKQVARCPTGALSLG